MAEKKLRFAIFGNTYQAKKSASIREILACLYRRGAEIYMERKFYEFLSGGDSAGIEVSGVFDDDAFDADFVISMGGDGTMLRSAAYVSGKDIPIIGVNMGRLGFLAHICPDSVEEAFGELFAGRYEVEEHSVIQVSAGGHIPAGFHCALNDISILKRDNASMISICTRINGEYLTTYRADGLIITTPTGSTAYSLSNGGPIIVPRTGILCLTPVAPHSLNIRPLVVPDDAVITLTVESRSHNFLIAADGRSADCHEGVSLEIKKAPYTIKTVKRPNSSYFATLREKMMWGADTRL